MGPLKRLLKRYVLPPFDRRIQPNFSLAVQVEVSLAILREGSSDDPAQLRARNEVADCVSSIQNQIELWKQAEQLRVLSHRLET